MTTKSEMNQAECERLYKLRARQINEQLAVLTQWAASLKTKPAGLHYGHVGDLARMRQALADATEILDNRA